MLGSNIRYVLLAAFLTTSPALVLSRAWAAEGPNDFHDKQDVVYGLWKNDLEGKSQLLFLDSMGRVVFEADASADFVRSPSFGKRWFYASKDKAYYKVTAMGGNRVDFAPHPGSQWVSEREGKIYCGDDNSIWVREAGGWQLLTAELSAFDLLQGGSIEPPASDRVRMVLPDGICYADELHQRLGRQKPYSSLTPMINGVGFGLRDGTVYAVGHDGDETAVSEFQCSYIMSDTFRGRFVAAGSATRHAVFGESGLVLQFDERDMRRVRGVYSVMAVVQSDETGLLRAFDLERGAYIDELEYPYMTIYSGGLIGFGTLDGKAGYMNRTGAKFFLDRQKGYYPAVSNEFILGFGEATKNVGVHEDGSKMVQTIVIDRSGEVVFDPSASEAN